MNVKKQFWDGLITQNPVLVQLLGMCPTLAITTSLFNGLGMGLSVLIILTCANVVISALRKIIPNKVRIACYIVVIASFVTIVEMVLKAYLPELSATLGLYIPLIVVNCIIFARAESFAFKNGPILALGDGLGMGLGFTAAITVLASVREIFGAGTFFGMDIMGSGYHPMSLLTAPAGGFLTLGVLLIIVNMIRKKLTDRFQEKKEAELA